MLAAATVGGVGYLAPALGLGAAAAGGVAVMAAQQCPNTRPCRVRSLNNDLWVPNISLMIRGELTFFPQRPSRRNRQQRVCCRPVGISGGRIRCPRLCV